MSIPLADSFTKPTYASRMNFSLMAVRRFLSYLLLGLGCVFVGLMIVFLPSLFIIGLVGAVVFIFMLWCFPWVGLGLYLLIALISPDFKASDVVTVAALTLIVFRLALQGNWRNFPAWCFTPYIVFVVLGALAILWGVFLFHNETPYVYRDGRVLLYWLWFPVFYAMAASEVDGEMKLSRLALFVGASIALLALLQYFTGIQLVAEGRVGALETMGSMDQSSTRVQMPGFFFISFLLVWAVLTANSGRGRLVVLVPAICVLALALYANFGRGLWIWTAAALLLSAAATGWARASRLFVILGIVAIMAGAVLSYIRPNTMDALVTRITSLATEGGAGTSYGWRKLENEDAILGIKRSPLLGIGMGGEYRRWMGEVSEFKEHTRYIHNGYLYVALKAGIPALLALVYFLFRSWRQGLRKFAERRSAGVLDLRLISTLAILPAVMGLSLTQPELMSAFGALFFSLMATILLVPSMPIEAAGRANRV